jgi:Uncharacterized conserved protein
MIFSFLRRKKANAAIVARQYRTITEAARQPGFYLDMNVPDTVMGRFEMISAHMVLYFRRLRGAGEAAEKIAQEVIEAFFEDLDHSIRELGVGDAAVPKRMKKIGRMFYGRANSYEAALDAGDAAALAAALARNIHPDAGDAAPDMTALARHLLAATAALESVGRDEIESGGLTFPAPALHAEARA